MNWQAICECIGARTGVPFGFVSAHAIGGGDINAAYRLQGKDRCYFVKLNSGHLVGMFGAEFAGLQALAQIAAVRVPMPVAFGEVGAQAYLVLEYLEFGRPTPRSEQRLGQQLAALHRPIQPYFGWSIDNTIGSTPQINTRTDSWLDFWREQRLLAQLRLAAQKGYGGRLQASGERLCSGLDALFASYRPQPSLLHGDLWAGNSAVDQLGEPVIFDPACYYGDREADIAMTELFGGYSRDFYRAYEDAWPLAAGYPVRRTLYNLYHILNHLNLFGGGYLHQAEDMIMRLLAELG